MRDATLLMNDPRPPCDRRPDLDLPKRLVDTALEGLRQSVSELLSRGQYSAAREKLERADFGRSPSHVCGGECRIVFRVSPLPHSALALVISEHSLFFAELRFQLG